MSSLVVLAFDTVDGATDVRDRLYELQKQELITLEDAAVVVRNEDGKVKVNQAHSLVGAGALGGAFWGMLIGLLFWVPWLGMAIGSVTGVISGKFTDIGVDDDFIKSVSESIDPGNSAIFLLIRDVQKDRVLEEIEGHAPTVLRTNLSPEQEQNLREAFGTEAPPA
ncbi:DUF1269 domain-containing protein [Halobium salinum]|uniref:DUF1269 domain-containing protein n=1 Tax=Halobium salinum TaxID=1364940 RepID=A0ABD5PHT4_9EURY|nr:DUF1269 domain-containing protein [Halobium salinum]